MGSPWTRGSVFCPSPGDLPLKSDGDAHWKIEIKPLRETKVGVAQA